MGYLHAFDAIQFVVRPSVPSIESKLISLPVARQVKAHKWQAQRPESYLFFACLLLARRLCLLGLDLVVLCMRTLWIWDCVLCILVIVRSNSYCLPGPSEPDRT